MHLGSHDRGGEVGEAPPELEGPERADADVGVVEGDVVLAQTESTIILFLQLGGGALSGYSYVLDDHPSSTHSDFGGASRGVSTGVSSCCHAAERVGRIPHGTHARTTHAVNDEPGE